MCPRLLSRRRVILRSSRTHTHTHGQRECWEEEKSKRCADYDGLSLSSSCSLHLIWQLPIIQFFGYCSWARPSNGRCLCFSLKKRENINKKNDFLQGRVKCVIFFALRIFRGPAIHRPIWQSKLKRPKKEKLRLWIKSSRNHVLSPFLFFRSRAKRKKEKPQRWMDGKGRFPIPSWLSLCVGWWRVSWLTNLFSFLFCVRDVACSTQSMKMLLEELLLGWDRHIAPHVESNPITHKQILRN
jgi:hypothetical protein